MNYIFLDLEYNQALVTNNFKMNVNKGCPHEIIEIGAVKLNEYLEMIDSFSSYVRNHAYHTLSPQVAKLTKIKKKDIFNADTFRDVMWKFNEWLNKDQEPYLVFSWGNDDYDVLQQNFEYSRVYKENTIWADSIIDLQKNICKVYKYKFKKDQIGLKKMLHYYKIDIDKRPHRASVDAEYTAKIFIKAMNRLGLKNSMKLLEE